MAEIEVSLTITRLPPGYRPVEHRDDYVIHPQVAELTERVVVATRLCNARLDWVEQPERFDRLIRVTASFQLGWTRRECPDDWLSHGLWAVAEGVQAELIEETTEPWPRRALDHPPGGRSHVGPHVEIAGNTARITYRDAADAIDGYLDLDLAGIRR
jgi:hypothetical protein